MCIHSPIGLVSQSNDLMDYYISYLWPRPTPLETNYTVASANIENIYRSKMAQPLVATMLGTVNS